MTYHHTFYRDGRHTEKVTLTHGADEPLELHLFYPTPFDDRPHTSWLTRAPGPFDVLFADDDTTAILRDVDGFAWIVHLPRGIVVQVLGTKP